VERPTICIDLDGVLASWKHGTFDAIGPPVPGAIDFTQRLIESYRIIIHTCRCTEELYSADRAQLRLEIDMWLSAHGFAYDSIWIGQGKPLAIAYIDDRAVVCRPEHNDIAFQKVESKLLSLVEQEGGAT